MLTHLLNKGLDPAGGAWVCHYCDEAYLLRNLDTLASASGSGKHEHTGPVRNLNASLVND